MIVDSIQTCSRRLLNFAVSGFSNLKRSKEIIQTSYTRFQGKRNWYYRRRWNIWQSLKPIIKPSIWKTNEMIKPNLWVAVSKLYNKWQTKKQNLTWRRMPPNSLCTPKNKFNPIMPQVCNRFLINKPKLKRLKYGFS